jgi:2-oxoglutarate ferredoxin oxidoreductase subunit alpha
VVLNVSRSGPGVGGIQPGQADYYQATRGGGNGDYHLIVYAPSSIQEAVNLIPKAFQAADEYRNPIMIFADGMLGQMMEPIILPDPIPAMKQKDIPKFKPWALTGTGETRSHNIVRSLYLKPEELEARILELDKKYEKAKKELVEYETNRLEDAEAVLVAYGSTARIAEEALDLLAEEGIKTGMIRPVSLWPYPYEAFDKIPKSVKVVLSVELSRGQMMDDVKIGCNGRYPVSLSSRTGGILITPPEIVRDVKNALGVAK